VHHNGDALTIAASVEDGGGMVPFGVKLMGALFAVVR
jgi:hypothetical protein